MGANAPDDASLSSTPPTTIVLGSQWGDEGKGKITNLLAERADLVARFQGGANAGHTVVIGEQTLILHQVPSGITSKGAMNVIGNGCVIDLIGLADEIRELREAGVEVSPDNLMLSSKAHLVTPVHRLIDGLRGGRIGTTGRGIGPCYSDKARRTGIRAESALDGTLTERYEKQVQECREVLETWHAGEVDDVEVALSSDALVEAAAEIAPYIGDAAETISKAYQAGKSVLYEGAQGTFLDIDHGTYPFVTSSNTTIGGAFTGTGVFIEFGRRIGIVKAYTTRVGNGPFPTELTNDLGVKIRERGHEYGATTGRPRRCGWLDLDLVRRATIANGFNEIALTKLDVLSMLDSIDVALSYDPEGRPEYRTLQGWATPIDDVRKFDDLPELCRAYVTFIEEQIGVPARTVSVGPERDQTIIREG